MGERFVPGQEVWLQPSAENSEFLHDDVAVIVEDFESCYLVIQEDELADSSGAGWVVQDFEVLLLRQ